ncbi:hypothetical protein LIER_02589 [Lithospermum erythrorhizon]|uniref:Protein RER1 n=1 Tax=Lithospermum erythrorhizon TaxID=34254 RepID=A0AAV3NRF5_LITER
MESGGGEEERATALSHLTFTLTQRYQHLLDKTTPFILHRWIFLLFLLSIYVLRVLILQGFYVVTYALGIYIIQLLLAFLSPQVDPQFQPISAVDGATLPIRESDEFRPFVRRLPEFKFWHSLVKGICFAFALTFFSAFDVPVFWPILLFYWVVLFISTMKRQIMHMIKYKYVPFTSGKQRYVGKKDSSADEESIAGSSQ